MRDGVSSDDSSSAERGAKRRAVGDGTARGGPAGATPAQTALADETMILHAGVREEGGATWRARGFRGNAACARRCHMRAPTPQSFLQVIDALETALAAAEARLVAARATAAPPAALGAALAAALAARGGLRRDRAPALDRRARVRALLHPVNAADWGASSPAAAAALASGGGGAVSDLSTLAVALDVGPCAGSTVALDAMLTSWSRAMFEATHAHFGARNAAVGGGCPTLFKQMRCFTAAWAAADPDSAMEACSLSGFADVGATKFLGGENAASRRGDVARAAAAMQLTPRQAASILALRVRYLATLAPTLPGRATARHVLSAALVGGAGPRVVDRPACAAALDAASSLAFALAAHANADLELGLGISNVITRAQGAAFSAARWPCCFAVVDLSEWVAAAAGEAPALAVLEAAAAW